MIVTPKEWQLTGMLYPFSDRYGDGRGLCNTLWGQSFVYTEESPDDPDRTCLSMSWPLNETNPNIVAIRNNFGSLVDTVTTPPCNEDGTGNGDGNGSGGPRTHASAITVMIVALLGGTLLGYN